MMENEYTITTLKDNPGIFYETVREMRVSETSWKMIIYTDLTNILGATTGLQRELNMTIRQCDNISEICKS